jgi:hypothetical protein
MARIFALRPLALLHMLRAVNVKVCRRRPTLDVAAVSHGRHPQTFTRAVDRTHLPVFRSLVRLSPDSRHAGEYLEHLRFVPLVLKRRETPVVDEDRRCSRS